MYIKLWEEFNQDDFVKKYFKSGEYISKSDNKKLISNLDISDKDINRLTKNIKSSIDFIEYFDFETFEDILNQMKDEIDYFRFGISKFLRISNDVSRLGRLGFDSKINVGAEIKPDKSLEEYLSFFLREIPAYKSNEIDKLKKSIEEFKSKRPGAIDYFRSYDLDDLSGRNLLKEVKIIPSISIYFDYEVPYESEERDKRSRYMSKYVEESINRLAKVPTKIRWEWYYNCNIDFLI